MADKPGDGLNLLYGEPNARTELERNFRAEFRMIAAPSLGDVVQEYCDIAEQRVTDEASD